MFNAHRSSTRTPSTPVATIRTRWAAIGAAVAVTLGGAGIGGYNIVNAEVASGDRTVLVTVDPCRLADTRSGSENVGPRSLALRAAETHTFDAQQSGVPCTGKISAAATSLLLNVTAVDATASTFVTFWSDGAQPKVSSLNPTPGQPPAPNAVTVGLSASQTFEAYNNAGSVDIIIDVVGYYETHNHDDRYFTKDQTRLVAQEIVNAETSSFLTASQVGAVAQELINAQAPDDTILRAEPADFVIARTATDGGGAEVPATGWSYGSTLYHSGTTNSECIYAPIRAKAGTTVSSISIRYTSAAGTSNGSVSLTGITSTPGPANFGTTGVSSLVNDQSVSFFSDSSGVIRNVDVAPTGTPTFITGHITTLQICTADNSLAIISAIVNTA